jgi:uncharacterized membrane protein
MTIAQQLKITEFPFIIKDSKVNVIYYENSYGYWSKSEYDSNGNRIYHEDSTGYWSKSEYDSKRNLIYHEDSTGYWSKSEYDSKGNLIYCENSDSKLIDKRPKKEIQKAIELLTKEGLLVNGKILKQ